jgi:DNA-binding transcriptional regulator PaaX
MTPYNPTGIIDTFTEENSIPGTILVSKLGKDGAIGDEDRKTLIQRVYGYKKLNDRYKAFIDQYTNRKEVSKTQRALDYHMILTDDPQLPFALEPERFLAKEAHRLSLQ